MHYTLHTTLHYSGPSPGPNSWSLGLGLSPGPNSYSLSRGNEEMKKWRNDEMKKWGNEEMTKWGNEEMKKMTKWENEKMKKTSPFSISISSSVLLRFFFSSSFLRRLFFSSSFLLFCLFFFCSSFFFFWPSFLFFSFSWNLWDTKTCPQFASFYWEEHTKTRNPLVFLQGIKNNYPEIMKSWPKFWRRSHPPS